MVHKAKSHSAGWVPEQAPNGGGSTRREQRPMSSHMAGGCPPRSAVASGPLKCELNFSAGSCAFGLFVTRRFGESERVSGPGATPPLAPSPVRIGSELSAAMPRSKEATSSKLFGCCAAHGHKPQQTTDNRPQASTSKGAASSPPRSLHWAYTAAPGGDHLHKRHARLARQGLRRPSVNSG